SVGDPPFSAGREAAPEAGLETCAEAGHRSRSLEASGATAHNLSLSFANSCQRGIWPARGGITAPDCRVGESIRLSDGSSFKLYSSFESLSRRHSFQPSGETTVRVDSSTARLIIRRRASPLPFFTFVRFGAHSRKTFCGAVISSLIDRSRLLPAHCG